MEKTFRVLGGGAICPAKLKALAATGWGQLRLTLVDGNAQASVAVSVLTFSGDQVTGCIFETPWPELEHVDYVATFSGGKISEVTVCLPEAAGAVVE